MVKKFSLVSAVAGMLTGSALLVAQAQQTETPPPAQPNQQDAEAGNQDQQDQDRQETEQNRQQQAQQERQREEQQRRQREQAQQRETAPDRAADQARERAPQAPRGPELDRPGIDRAQPGAAQREFEPGRRQFEQGQPGQRPFERGPDARGQFEGRAQFDRGAQEQRQGVGLNLDSTEQGELTVQSIEQGSPAARIGLQEGDRIVSVDGRTFESGEQLNQFLVQQRGQRVPIVIERDGRRETVFWMAEQRFGPAPGDPRFAQDQFGPPQGFADGRMHGQQQMEGARAALGVHLDPHAPAVVVSRVAPGSPAEQAGIRPGDEIIALNGQQLRHFSELINQAGQLPLDQPATLEIVSRGDQQPQPVQINPEPWQVVFRDSGRQQFGQTQQFGQPQYGQPQYGQPQFGWSQQQFGAAPQYGAQPQYGGQMGLEQRGQFEMRQQPMGQPYGVARPPLGQGMQSGGSQQEIDELHREIDRLREQVQQLRQQMQSHDGAAPGRPGDEGARPGAPQQPQNVPQREREI